MAEENTNNKNAAKNAAKASAELKKQKKKKWVPIVAPELFSQKVLGESLLDDASQLMNRTITVNMAQLIGDMKRQNMNIMFKVVDVKEGKGHTIPVKFEISSSSIKRLAKREKDKLSDSFVVKTQDGKLVRIKPLMITNNLTKGSVSAALIRTARAVCKEFVNKLTFENLIADLVNYKFQKEVKDALHRTYPLRVFDIRLLELETKKKKETVEEEELLKLKKQREQMDLDKKEKQELEQKQYQGNDDQSSEGTTDDEPVNNVPEDQETSSEETDDEDADDSQDDQ